MNAKQTLSADEAYKDCKRYDFLIGPFNWKYELGDNGMTVSTAISNESIAWHNVTGAGISPKKGGRRHSSIPADNDIFPGLGRLAGFAGKMEGTTELLLVSCRSSNSKIKLLTLNIHNTGKTRDSLVADLRSRLGDRWIGEGIDQFELRKTLGFSNWWTIPAATVSVGVAALSLLGWWYLQDKFWLPMAAVASITFIITLRRTK